MILKTFFLSGLLILIVITSFQLIKKDHWIFRFSDFPHVQLTMLTGVFFIGLLVTTNFLGPWYFMLPKLAGLVAIGYQLTIIYPYTELSAKQSKNTNNDHKQASISILEANVFMKNDQYDKLIDLVKKYKPDVFITLESDQLWEDALSVLDKEYPYAIKRAYDNTYGMHLFSKLELKNTSVNFLIGKAVPSFETDVILNNGQKIRLFIVHPEPPSPTEKDTSTPRDAELILVAKKAKKCDLPVIVAGDLNDVAWSHTTRLFQRISKLLDPRIGRGFFNTFHAKYPLLRWPLDHIFHSREFLVSDIQRLSTIGSDHFPMFIKLNYDPTNGETENGETDDEDTEDKKEAKKTVNEAK